MKRYLMACLLSAALGALAASTRQELNTVQTAQAQEGVAPVVQRFQPPNASQARTTALPETASASPTPAEKSSSAFRPLTAGDSSAPADSLAPDELWTAEERINISVYERVNRSVVNIMTRTVRPDFFLYAEVAEGSGSGFVLDQEGHILTNLHVVEGAREIRVTLHTGETYDAGLVGQDELNDVAVLRIAAPAEDLHPVKLAQPNRLRVGQKVYAIGNPFGLERTLTVGIISSLNRTLPARNNRRMKSIIQIDAALNRGNSGGPLVNSRAELIGMNTAIASSTGENTGVGFAIPVATLQRVVPQLIQQGRVIRPDSGIVPLQTDRGLAIAQLTPGGPGERAGLQGFQLIRERRQRGPYLYERTRIDQSHADVILKVDGTPVRTRDDFLSAIELKQPGQQVVLTIRRDGQELEIPVTLDASEP